jgi:glycosyltransferase involved in cell wall biosynthesis
VIVQHNGVDGERFTIRSKAEARRRLGLPTDDPIICYVGNLAAEKGVDLLVDAMYTLRHDGDRSARLVIVGAGALEADLRRRARQLRVSESVHFFGRRPHHEVPIWLSASDVCCLASRREGCPNVVLEALASGRPVVAADVGGVSELVNPSNGITVAPESSLALAAGLHEALGRPWDPAALRDTVLNLSWEPFGRALHDILAELHQKSGDLVARSAASPVSVAA